MATPAKPFGSSGDLPRLPELERSTSWAIYRKPRMQAALKAFLDAYEYVRDLDASSWEFALEMPTLRRLGMSNSDLRWLIGRGLVDHAVEVTRSGAAARGFRQPPQPVFSKRACFILTPAGAAVAHQFSSQDEPPSQNVVLAVQRTTRLGLSTSADSSVPKWERDRQELRVGSVVVKRFNLPALDQVAILAAFEESAWPERIDNPLPAHPDQPNRGCLQDAIEALNRNQKRLLVRFTEDGNGQGVLWKLAGIAKRAGEP